MADLISRDALIHVLGDPKLMLMLDGKAAADADEWGMLLRRMDVLRCVLKAPIIDAVPVVRCKDCKHRGTCDCPMLREIEYYDEDDGWDYRDIDNTDDDGFCHNGAKMDGGVPDG